MIAWCSNLMLNHSHLPKQVSCFYPNYGCGIDYESPLVGLRPSENITVQLAASTVLGQGPFSEEIVVSNKEAGKAIYDL